MEPEKQQLLSLFCLKFWIVKSLSMLMKLQKGLSPFQPEKVSFEAGRIMLHRIPNYSHKMEILHLKLHLQLEVIKTEFLKRKRRITM